MKIMAIDYGDAHTGIAVSDALLTLAGFTTVITAYRPEAVAAEVQNLIAEHGVTELVLGHPLNMDGTAGFQSEKVKAFCEQLEKAGLSVVYQDERLTTVTATNAPIEGNMHRAERKHNVDKVAAAVILQQYLDTCRNQQQQEAAKMEEQDNIIELIDDETGAPIRFQHLATIEYEGELYIALSEADAPEDGQCEVFIMQVAQEEDGTESYIQVEDEAVQQAVFDKFLQLVNEGSGDDE